ncbi:alanine--tRNA ligase [Patescibacteria group bacterium]|nr:alanine--tRNA ligase [Patescibacteria group bacterium]
MTSKELKEKYIKFFLEKGHREIPSASLVPENDPSVLFTTAGMHPLVPYLLSEDHPLGARLVNVQKCVRTGDIEDVGDSTHNTFFEMLGNWSLGDYFKSDSIRWSWEFLTGEKWLAIDPKRIKVTVFEGDGDSPRDETAIKVWKKCFEKAGIEGEIYSDKKGNNETARIFPLPKEDNWWGPAGETGPCGPDTEIFIDLKKPVNFEKCPSEKDCKPGCPCGRYVEIWNNVFMEYFKTADGKFRPLKQKNIDTGMGMERTLAILNGFDNIYKTDALAPIVAQVKSEVQELDDEKSVRIISDHIRASVFIISDGITPSNLDRGYILRRLLRRAIRHGNLLKLPNGFLLSLAETVIDIYKDFYPELVKNRNIILEEIKKEEEKFEKTLEKGLKEFKRIESRIKNQELRIIEKGEVFNLYQSYGFPIEMTKELAKEKGLEIDEEGFNEEFKKHQQLSRTASVGKFKGGLADTSEETTRLHTAAHLLLESLRRVLGEHVFQKGSNITAERLRFDYSHADKLTDEEKQKVEEMVNEQIQKKLSVSCDEMSLEEAKKIGAMGVFEAKYGEKVKVYAIVPSTSSGQAFSKEICGGPHVKNTSELGKFRIKKEQSSSAGVRRIKAVLE